MTNSRCGAAWLLTAPLVGLLLPAAYLVRWSLRALAESERRLAAALDPDLYLGSPHTTRSDS